MARFVFGPGAGGEVGAEGHFAEGGVGVEGAVELDVGWDVDGEGGGGDDEAVGEEDEGWEGGGRLRHGWLGGW